MTLWCGCLDIINLENIVRREDQWPSFRAYFFFCKHLDCLPRSTTGAACCQGNKGIDDDCHGHAREKVFLSINGSPVETVLNSKLLKAS